MRPPKAQTQIICKSDNANGRELASWCVEAQVSSRGGVGGEQAHSTVLGRLKLESEQGNGAGWEEKVLC